MDEFDFVEKKPRRRLRFGAALLNLVSLGILVATIALGAYYVLLFLNPQSEFNPFPPPDTSGTAAEAIPATEVAVEVSDEATATDLPEPTATTVPPTSAATHEAGSYYEIQPGSPVALDSSIFHPDFGCSFMGVAGQAFGLDNAPIPGLRVRVSGMLNGEAIDKLGLTGAASQYGAGSYYEIVLGDEPIASEGDLEIQVVDADGFAASDAFSFSTFSSCEQNLISINFNALP